MQILENCMEDMKAVYKLNEEKLYFNLIVLKQRSAVLKKTKKAMKKKKQAEQEKERKQRGDFFAQQQMYQVQNQKLTSLYKQFTRMFKDTQQKYENFEKSDESGHEVSGLHGVVAVRPPGAAAELELHCPVVVSRLLQAQGAAVDSG